MSILVDLIILGIVALCTFIGYKQGLIKSAIKILAFFIAIIVAITLYKPVSKLIINNTTIDEKIQSSISDKILPEGANEEDEVEVNSNIPNVILDAAENTVNSISTTITVKIIEGVTLLLIYIIVKIGLKFVTVLADIIGKIPIIKQFNEMGRNSIWLLKRNSCCLFNSCHIAANLSTSTRKHYKCGRKFFYRRTYV